LRKLTSLNDADFAQFTRAAYPNLFVPLRDRSVFGSSGHRSCGASQITGGRRHFGRLAFSYDRTGRLNIRARMFAQEFMISRIGDGKRRGGPRRLPGAPLLAPEGTLRWTIEQGFEMAAPALSISKRISQMAPSPRGSGRRDGVRMSEGN